MAQEIAGIVSNPDDPFYRCCISYWVDVLGSSVIVDVPVTPTGNTAPAFLNTLSYSTIAPAAQLVGPQKPNRL